MQDKVIILGAGLPEGVGGALARRFAREDLHVFVSGRTLEKVEQTAAQITASGGSAEAIEADVTSEDDLDALFSKAGEREGALAAVIYNAGNNMPIPFADLSPEQFEFYWRVGCYGGFLTAKRAMPILEAQGEGSMLFTLAREYGPKGVHVAHIIIDGVVNGDRAQTNFGDYLDNLGPDGALDPDAIADAYWTIHAQQRSAWTHELDLRPFSETW